MRPDGAVHVAILGRGPPTHTGSWLDGSGIRSTGHGPLGSLEIAASSAVMTPIVSKTPSRGRASGSTMQRGACGRSGSKFASCRMGPEGTANGCATPSGSRGDVSSRYQSSGYAIEAKGSAALEKPGGASGRTGGVAGCGVDGSFRRTVWSAATEPTITAATTTNVVMTVPT